MTGTLEVYRGEEFITSNRYSSLGYAQALRDRWKKLYGKLYDKLTIKDIPDNHSDRHKSNFKKGEMVKVYHLPK